MNNISKLGEDIEKRLQNIEFTQEETSKIFIELNNKLNTLEDQVKNTHQTFNLLLQNNRINSYVLMLINVTMILEKSIIMVL